MEKIPYLGTTITRWKVGSSTFLAAPEIGAKLMHWSMTLPDGTIRDILYWPEIKDASEIAKARGGNPILFPFAGRCYDHGKLHHWLSPDGKQLPMPMHGFARQGTFKTIRLDPHGFTSLFVPDDAARAAYPYDYEFTVSYRFSSLSIACELSLKNLGNTPLPWCAGHHFYFTLPWTESLTRNDYKIRIPSTKTYRHNYDTGSLVPGPKFKTDESLGNFNLSDTIHAGLKKNTVTFGSPEAPGEITVQIGPDKIPNPEYVCLTWSESQTAPYYCVEPWMGAPNAPENKTGLHWVAPSATQTFLVNITAK